MGMRELYQRKSLMLSLVFTVTVILGGLLAGTAYAGPYSSNDCDNACTNIQTCVQDTSAPLTFACRNIAPSCFPACSGNETCVYVPNNSGTPLSTCRARGSSVNTNLRIRCDAGGASTEVAINGCPSGSTCGNCVASACYCVDSDTGEDLVVGNTANYAPREDDTSETGAFQLGIDQIVDALSADADPAGVGKFMSLLYKILLPVGITLGVLLVAVAGYGLMTSQGDPKRVMAAREQLTSAIMGLLFVLLGVGILRAIIGTLIQGNSPGL